MSKKMCNFAAQSVVMDKLKPFKIELHGLKEGKNIFNFKLDDSFFDAVESDIVRCGNLDVEMEIDRKSSLFEVMFHIKGDVIVPCDLCLDDMEQPVDTDNGLIVKFGNENSEDDDLVTVAEDEGILDVSWFIYEFIVLNIPIKHVHAPGKCNRDMMKALEEHSATRSGVEDEDAIDPRWKELLKLKE